MWLYFTKDRLQVELGKQENGEFGKIGKNIKPNCQSDAKALHKKVKTLKTKPKITLWIQIPGLPLISCGTEYVTSLWASAFVISKISEAYKNI